MEPIAVTPHEIEWTPERVRRFWAFWPSTAGRGQHYFSNEVGKEIIAFARSKRAIGARVLDFGCGPGFLLKHLVAMGIPCQGLDVSPDSLAEVTRRLGNSPLFQGAILSGDLPVPVKDESFDTIFLIETIEHLLPGNLEKTLQELRRLLARGGHLIITTPNEEDLRANQIHCPECGAIFHPVQHAQAFSRDSLRSILEKQQYQVAAAETRTMRRPSWLNPILNIAWRLRGKKDANLLAIARKP